MRKNFFAEVEKIREQEQIPLSLKYDCRLEEIASQILETDDNKSIFAFEGGIHLLFSSGSIRGVKKSINSRKNELESLLRSIGCNHRKSSGCLCVSRNSVKRFTKECREDLHSIMISIGCNYRNSQGTHMYLCLYKTK
ncbi:hypothetical protein OESDEN_07359 [Oesophagostomum dentatum]|uniref:Uncharacterized protein n=1 Tax=Oesophagostomum dentatum TaxID=61180 RepID=A0A0B1TAB5_OESDE|nr:hypothetical protein OESDEN_07359 [Oesophagostomum dentatum]